MNESTVMGFCFQNAFTKWSMFFLLISTKKYKENKKTHHVGKNMFQSAQAYCSWH